MWQGNWLRIYKNVDSECEISCSLVDVATCNININLSAKTMMQLHVHVICRQHF